MLDARGARPAVIAGSALAVAGFWLWADAMPDADLSTQWYWIVLSGAGLGLVLSPVSTDALNRAPRGSFGEVTGVTQTVRYFASSLGLAIMGTIFINKTGDPRGGPSGLARHLVADASRTVFLIMAGVMAVCLVVAVATLQRGIPEQVTAQAAADPSAA